MNLQDVEVEVKVLLLNDGLIEELEAESATEVLVEAEGDEKEIGVLLLTDTLTEEAVTKVMLEFKDKIEERWTVVVL